MKVKTTKTWRHPAVLVPVVGSIGILLKNEPNVPKGKVAVYFKKFAYKPNPNNDKVYWNTKLIVYYNPNDLKYLNNKPVSL